MNQGLATVPSLVAPASSPPPSWQRLRELARRHQIVAAAVFFGALTLFVFGRVLVGDADRVLSNEDADLAMQFVHWRSFGFGEMRAGHLPLWNPHIFSGAPFLGGFQSALLYPPNWLYLVLPLGRAINVGIALHVFLGGFFMYLWARERGLRPLAGALAGVLFMFSGPYFAHIYAGHLPNLCAMVWGPLIFLAIDRWLERRTVGAVLLGGGAVALQILAGHPQYVFYTGIAAGFYVVLGLIPARRRWQAAAGLALMPVVAVALSAVQLLEGFHAAGESVRSHGVTFAFAALFSFPPENFLTAAVPGFFGEVCARTYWGRCAFWEMSLFIGATGTVFAIYGAVRGEAGQRFRLLAVAAVLLLLALGVHTPLFHWLYQHAPGFNKFRGQSKFIYPAVLCLIMLAASGFDALLAALWPETALIAGTAGAGLLLAGGALFLWPGGFFPAGTVLLTQAMNGLYDSGEVLLPHYQVQSLHFQAVAAQNAVLALLLAADTLLILSFVLLVARRRPAVLGAVLLLAGAEMLLFAEGTLETFSLAGAQESPASDYLADHPLPAGTRILNQENANLAMSIGARDLWGYDPGVVRRYAEFMADSQGIDPARLDEELNFTCNPALYGSLLRCQDVFSPESTRAADPIQVFAYPAASVPPRVWLVSEARVLPGRDPILGAMRAPGFDPRQTVCLETPPLPSPVSGPGAAGTATLLAETSDSLTVDATLARPAILVIPDTFCSGWRVRSLLPSGARNPGQEDYQILPADYCLRAIPLAAGHHRLLVYYRPPAFVIGAWISALALVLYLVAVSKQIRGQTVEAE